MPAKELSKTDPRAWDAVTPPLSEWILDAIKTMGFARMTPVQASTIPLFLLNKDVVVEVRILFSSNLTTPTLTSKPRLLLEAERLSRS